MSSKAVLDDGRGRLEKALAHLKDQLKRIRTGRASSALVEGLRVDYYGTQTPISQMAQISIPEPRQILIKPFDAGALKDIEKAIRSSDLGLAPNNDGKVIRLNIPAMSGDQRKKLVQQIKKLAEDAKVACRNIRRDGNKAFETAEKDKKINEDELTKGKEKVQDLLKKYETGIDDLADKKSKEVMEG